MAEKTTSATGRTHVKLYVRFKLLSRMTRLSKFEHLTALKKKVYGNILFTVYRHQKFNRIYNIKGCCDYHKSDLSNLNLTFQSK